MAQQLCIRTSLIEYTHLADQTHQVTSQSSRDTLLPLCHLIGVVDLGTQIFAHALVDLFLSEGVVFERHGGLAPVSLGGEDVV